MRLKEIDIQEWAELISRYSGVSLFHTPEWIQTLMGGFPHIEIKLYKIVDDGNREVGLVPVEVTRKGPLKLVGSPLPRLLTPYQGPILLNPSDDTMNKVFELITISLRPHYFTISLEPAKTEKVDFGKNISVYEFKKTIIIDLTLGIDNLWKNFKAETRNQVRQAQRYGVEIYEPKSLDDWLNDYYKMYESVYLRQSIKPPAKPLFYQAIWESFYRKGQLKVILAKYKDTTIAGGIFLVYKDTIYFLDGASLREYQKFRANNLIQWYIINWACSQGLQFYDMVGANIPSIAHFKKGFGGKEVEYPYLQSTHGFIGKVSYFIYQKYRRILRRFGV